MTEAVLSSASGDVQAALDAGIQIAMPQPLGADGRFYAAYTPAGGNVHIIDLEQQADEFRTEPARKTGVFTVHDAKGFVDYYAKHGRPETEVWADVTSQTVVGVIDAHGDRAGWSGHRVMLKMQKTPAWQAWIGGNRQKMAQVDFADFVEDRRLEILDPDAATLAEIAHTFKAKKSVDFQESHHLSTGQVQLQYAETIQAAAGKKGNLEIPEAFKLGLQPFEGSDRYEMTARLRFDISSGRMLITYVLDRPEETLRQAFGDVVDLIEGGVDAPVFRGVPAL